MLLYGIGSAGIRLHKFNGLNHQNIHILVIAPYRFLPSVNGGHKAIEQLYSHVGKIAKVVIVSVKSNNDSFAKNFRLVKLFSDSPLHYINPLLYFRLRKLIREEQITHLISEHPYMGWLLFLLQKTLRVPWTMRSHNIEAMRFKTLGKWWWKAMWQYEKWICNKANFTFFITEEDKESAIKNYLLPEEKGTVVTFGIDNKKAPSADEKKEAADFIKKQYGILSSHRILLFNGDLGYAPNEEAVRIIVENIYPSLLQSHFPFAIFICGRNLNSHLAADIEKADHIIYTGFVNDIRQYFLAADIFINPVISGGGIKTKLVEALSYNCNAVSTESGATGIPAGIADKKLIIVADNDWTAFVKAIVETDTSAMISGDFYDSFYWGNIARKALTFLESL